MPAPQYRKYVLSLLDLGLEVIDLYPVFKEWVDIHGADDLLFSKDHHISPMGAKLVADTIADYLKRTTTDIKETLKVNQNSIMFYDHSDLNDDYLSKTYVNCIEGTNEVVWRFNEKCCPISVFGDCNLQSYRYLGAGIQANLVYNLKGPVFDGGRVLIFDDKRERINLMSKQMLDEIKTSEIMIYVAFGSASFVRTSVVLGRQGVIDKLKKDKSLANYKWACFDL